MVGDAIIAVPIAIVRVPVYAEAFKRCSVPCLRQWSDHWPKMAVRIPGRAGPLRWWRVNKIKITIR
jgi:hypothetical protein